MNKSKLLLFVLVLLLTVFGCRQAPEAHTDLRVHFINVGQGDSILIQGPAGENVLIDGGEREPGVVSYLKKQGVKNLHAVVATHPHTDHIGGLIAVLKEIPVSQVWINGQAQTTKTYEDFLNALDKSGAGFNEARRGGKIVAGGLTFDILNPKPPFTENMNDNSVVLRLVYGQVSFLFTGDAETTAERGILSYTADLKTTILKLGHHGSRTATSEAFLKAVQPEVAAYMAGEGNSYGHPHKETLTKMKQWNTRVYGADVNGTIVVSTAGTSYSVQTEKGSELKLAWLSSNNRLLSTALKVP